MTDGIEAYRMECLKLAGGDIDAAQDMLDWVLGGNAEDEWASLSPEDQAAIDAAIYQAAAEARPARDTQRG